MLVKPLSQYMSAFWRATKHSFAWWDRCLPLCGWMRGPWCSSWVRHCRGQDASTSQKPSSITRSLATSLCSREIICTYLHDCLWPYWMSIYIHSMWRYWLFQESSKAMETSKLFDSELTDKWIHDETVFILFHHVDLATQQVKPTCFSHKYPQPNYLTSTASTVSALVKHNWVKYNWVKHNWVNHKERKERSSSRKGREDAWGLKPIGSFGERAKANCTLLESSTAVFIYAMFTCNMSR